MSTRFDNPEGLVAGLVEVVRRHPNASVTTHTGQCTVVDHDGTVLGHLDPYSYEAPFVAALDSSV